MKSHEIPWIAMDAPGGRVVSPGLVDHAHDGGGGSRQLGDDSRELQASRGARNGTRTFGGTILRYTAFETARIETVPGFHHEFQ